jgi:hypothetical protein
MEANFLWRLLQSISQRSLQEKFGLIELKVCKLVVSYCCYFHQGFTVPSPQYRASTKQSYYTLAKQIAQQGKIKCTNNKLSSIVADSTMSEIIRLMEE